MSYIEEILMSNEKIIFVTRPHVIIFIPVVIWLIISILPLIFGHKLGLNTVIFFNLQFNTLLTLIALFIAIVHALACYIRYISSEFAVTNKRIIMKTGLIKHNSLEIFLNKIESIHIRQNLLGRILGYGAVVISGTGGDKDPFNYIPNPLYFRNKVQQQLDKLKI